MRPGWRTVPGCGGEIHGEGHFLFGRVSPLSPWRARSGWGAGLHAMTYDEVCNAMATKSGNLGAPEWSDFFSMGRPQQEACATLYRNAIWMQPGGPSAWEEGLSLLGVAATIFGEASGIGSAFSVLKALV